jgi:hypothetical protein
MEKRDDVIDEVLQIASENYSESFRYAIKPGE